MLRCTGVKVAVSCHTTITEEILILKVGTIAPAHDSESYQVLLTRLDELRNIKFTFQLTVFAVTYKFPVDIQSYV